MKGFVVFVFLAAAAVNAQRGGGGGWDNVFGFIRDRYDQRDVIDTLHEYRFVEHSSDSMSQQLLIAINDHRDERTCYVVVVYKGWESLLEDHRNVEVIVDELYHLIMDPNLPSQTITTDNLENYFHDVRGADKCRGHTIHVVNYVPSIAPTDISYPTLGSIGTTQPPVETSTAMPSTTPRARPIG